MRTSSRLLAITPGTARDAAGVQRLTRQLGVAFEAGLRLVSLREPHLSDALLLELLQQTLALSANYEHSWVGVHDSLHVALAGGAQGVHLGFRSLEPGVALEVAAGRLSIGVSAHASDDPRGAGLAAASYASFGPVCETPSKREWLEPTGFDGLRKFCAAAPCPVYALGGMHARTVPRALQAGAHGVAAIRGVFDSGALEVAVANYLEVIEACGGAA